MNTDRQVIVVGGIRETEQVLKAVLEPRGWNVSRRRGEGFTASAADRPRLVVLHPEETDEKSAALLDRAWGDVPRVVVGTMTRPDHARGGSTLSQPFQYGDLLKAIDDLLEEPPARRALRAAA